MDPSLRPDGRRTKRVVQAAVVMFLTTALVLVPAGISMTAPSGAGAENRAENAEGRGSGGAEAKQVDWVGPAGNNGTVKVDGEPFDDHPDNEPHPGCVFQIDFYNYDEGDLDAVYTFALQPPSGTAELLSDTVAIGEDPNGGGTDLDASVTVDLTEALVESGATRHPQQGFHVKLTVNAEGSIGADVKHKVFWVECELPTAPPAGGGGITPPGGGGVIPPEVGGEVDTRGDAEVQGRQQERAEVLGVQFARGELAVTGPSLWTLAFLGFALIAAGLALTRMERRTA